MRNSPFRKIVDCSHCRLPAWVIQLVFNKVIKSNIRSQVQVLIAAYSCLYEELSEMKS